MKYRKGSHPPPVPQTKVRSSGMVTINASMLAGFQQKPSGSTEACAPSFQRGVVVNVPTKSARMTDLERLYFFLATSPVLPQSFGVDHRGIVVASTAEAASLAARALKGLGCKAYHIHKRTAPKTVAVHLRAVFGDPQGIEAASSSSGAGSCSASILVVANDALPNLKRAKLLRRPFFVVPTLGMEGFDGAKADNRGAVHSSSGSGGSSGGGGDRFKPPTVSDALSWERSCAAACRGWPPKAEPSFLLSLDAPKAVLTHALSLKPPPPSSSSGSSSSSSIGKSSVGASASSSSSSSSPHLFVVSVSDAATASAVRARVRAVLSLAAAANAASTATAQQKLDVLLAMPLRRQSDESSSSLSSSKAKAKAKGTPSLLDCTRGGDEINTRAIHPVSLPPPPPITSVKETKAKMLLLGMLGSSSLSSSFSSSSSSTTSSLASNHASGRVAAATRWLDGEPASPKFGGLWPGVVRFGSSPDVVSRSVRELHDSSRSTRGGSEAHRSWVQHSLRSGPSPASSASPATTCTCTCSTSTTFLPTSARPPIATTAPPSKKRKTNSSSLAAAAAAAAAASTAPAKTDPLVFPSFSKSCSCTSCFASSPSASSPPSSPTLDDSGPPTLGWFPNPADATDSGAEAAPSSSGGGFGGCWGRACGHNEVVMHILRPFQPMEVLNTRMCSWANPAPGNKGWHGCLEFLRLQCRRHHRAATVWDVECLHFIDSQGAHTAYAKTDLLASHRSLLSLAVVWRGLKALTLGTAGAVPPWALLRLVACWVLLGATGNRLECRLEAWGRACGGGAVGKVLKTIRETKKRKDRKATPLISLSPTPAAAAVPASAPQPSSSVLLPRAATRAIVAFLVGSELSQWREAISVTPPSEWVWGF